jgi:tetratricopeptide (TPR) repeat protein
MPLALTLHDAQRLHLAGRLEEAEAAYRSLSDGASTPELLYLHGTLLLERGDAVGAAALLGQAVALRPEWPEAYANLGTAFFRQQHLVEARTRYSAAIRLSPQDARYHASLAATFVHQGAPRDALAHCQTALSLDPECAQAHWNAALAHLELGEWGPGWCEYDWGFATGERTRRMYHEDGVTPEWTGKPGKSVVLH